MSDSDEEIFDSERSEGVEYESFGDRLQSSCLGICLGIVFFIAAFPLLYWNEDRAVERYDALNEAEGEVLTLFNPLEIDPLNEGRLIHFSVSVTNGDEGSNGNTTTTSLIDPIFGVEAPNALKLEREAEMYQWVETKETRTQKTAGGGKKRYTTYSYSTQWRDYLVNSGTFNDANSDYQNPSSMEFMSETFVADSIKIGAFDLPDRLVDRIDWGEKLYVTLDDITDEELRGRARSDNGGYYIDASYNDYGNNNKSSSYLGGAQVGDQRVFFRETPSSIITIVGVQSGGTLGAFVSETGEGGDILLFKKGNLTSVEMFDAAENENKIITWLIRLGGFALMTLGLYLVFRPIEVFADIIPCVGSIIGCGLIFMAVVISAVLSVVTISIAWLMARPEIGAIVLGVSLVVVGLCAFGVKKFVKKNYDDDDDDEFIANDNGGKVVGEPPAAEIPTVMAAADPPTVYALPEGQVMATAPQQQPYVYTSTAPQQEPTVTVSAEPYVPKY